MSFQCNSENRSNYNIEYGILSTSRNHLYNIYFKIKHRCLNPNCKDYKYYGMRGITICKEWMSNYFYFRDWAVKSGYQDGLTIERIDVNGNYEPNNCTWITLSMQQFNKRLYARNKSGYRGVIWDKEAKKWKSVVSINGKDNFVGRYNDLNEAVIRRNLYITENNLNNKLNDL